MRKLLLCLMLGLGLCIPSFATGEDAVSTGEKRDIMVIDTVFNMPLTLKSSSDEKMHVVFRHSDHKSMQCAVCHHKVTPAAGRYVTCGADEACHNIPGVNAEGKSQFMAYHDRESERSCYGCHYKERGRFEGVKGCTTCHKGVKEGDF